MRDEPKNRICRVSLILIVSMGMLVPGCSGGDESVGSEASRGGRASE